MRANANEPSRNRIVDAIHCLRPEWNIRSIEKVISGLSPMSNSEIAVAVTRVAVDPESKSPNRLLEPMYRTAIRIAIPEPGTVTVSVPVISSKLCTICGRGPHARTDHEWSSRPPTSDDKVRLAALANARTGIEAARHNLSDASPEPYTGPQSADELG